MKRFKNILLIDFSETECPFRFFGYGRGFLHKMLILIISLNLFSWFVFANRSSAWTARVYVEGKDIGTSSVMIGVASEAHWAPTDPNSATLCLITPEWDYLSEDIREEGNMRYTWIIWVILMGNQDNDSNPPPLTAILSWDPSSFSKAGNYELWEGSDVTGSIVVPDMRATEGYSVKDQQIFTVVFTVTENDADDLQAIIYIEGDTRGGCFIATCASQK